MFVFGGADVVHCYTHLNTTLVNITGREIKTEECLIATLNIIQVPVIHPTALFSQTYSPSGEYSITGIQSVFELFRAHRFEP